MKSYVIAIFGVLIIGFCSAALIHDDGQPGCKLQAELVIESFRNTWDPTRYWSCKQRDQAAVSVRCPDQTGWLDSVKKCVDWDNWSWEEPTPPMSRP
ncbi:uncharacterized protein LOC129942736 [Eupeodes corollae]|uniref:uncharacterized protein LOC129942736 n=1 Tax=Eupeodes corollae TaxID=290404 RepID=UPI0024924D5C|nr:uncharacterized protein LOC129942736 [Eupeodes corollae]